MSTTILVTGATGTVGSQTVKALTSLGASVRAGVRSVVKGENLKRLPGVELVEIDFSRPETLTAAFTGIDTAFLITPFSEDQVQMARLLVDAAKTAGVQHLVRLSVSGAEVEPGIQLGRWHREAEEYVKASGIPYTLLRPVSFMQNFVSQHAATIHAEGKFYQPVGQNRVTYIDARDIGAVAAEVLRSPETHKGKAYSLTGPQALTSDEIAAIFSEVLSKPVTYQEIPEEAARAGMQSAGIPDWMTDSLLELYSLCRAGYASGTTDEVEQILGRPPHSFHDFVETYQKCF